MAQFPIIVKRRDSQGKFAQVLCDTVEDARNNRKHFHDQGYKDVWMEDVDGRKIDESKL